MIMTRGLIEEVKSWIENDKPNMKVIGTENSEEKYRKFSWYFSRGWDSIEWDEYHDLLEKDGKYIKIYNRRAIEHLIQGMSEEVRKANGIDKF